MCIRDRSLVSSWILDGCKAIDRELVGYCVLVGMAALFVVQSYRIVSRIDYFDAEDCTKKHSLITIFTEPLKNRQFLPVVLYLMLWNFAVYMTCLLYTSYLTPTAISGAPAFPMQSSIVP